jgi:hypothetical protein
MKLARSLCTIRYSYGSYSALNSYVNLCNIVVILCSRDAKGPVVEKSIKYLTLTRLFPVRGLNLAAEPQTSPNFFVRTSKHHLSAAL